MSVLVTEAFNSTMPDQAQGSILGFCVIPGSKILEDNQTSNPSSARRERL